MKQKLSKEVYEAVKGILGDFITEDGDDRVFEGEPAKDVIALKSTLKKERDRADKAEKSLKDFDGLDVDKAKDALAAVESGKLKTDTEVQQAIRAAAKKATEDAKLEAQKTIDALTGEVNTHKLVDPVRVAATKAGVLPKRVEKEVQLNLKRFKLEGDKVVVLDADGDPTSKTLEDFWSKDYKADNPEVYTPNGGGGSGSNGSNGGGGGGKTILRADFNKLPAAEQSTTALDKTVTIVD